jgi:hypothetical protein
MLFGRRVGLDLYRFLESFATQATGDAILIPTSALDRCAHGFRSWHSARAPELSCIGGAPWLHGDALALCLVSPLPLHVLRPILRCRMLQVAGAL